jgi:hypothetical protein
MALRPLATSLALVVAVVASLTLGCKNKDKDDDKNNGPDGDDDVAAVENGSDTAAVESDSQLVTSSLVTGAPGAVGLASVGIEGGAIGPRAFGDNTVALYFPRGCLTVTNDAAAQTATYRFNRCMGPNGLRNVTGDVVARYQSDGGQLRLDVTATELRVNRAVVDWSASAAITERGAVREMKWTAQLSGTTARGRTFDRSNEQTITWTLGEACFELNGTSQGQVNSRVVHTQIESFRRCRRACPDAGGKIAITDVTKNKRFELRYDGSNQATFVDPKGREVAIPLLCSP